MRPTQTFVEYDGGWFELRVLLGALGCRWWGHVAFPQKKRQIGTGFTTCLFCRSDVPLPSSEMPDARLTG